jgi:hypothetical protein
MKFEILDLKIGHKPWNLQMDSDNTLGKFIQIGKWSKIL